MPFEADVGHDYHFVVAGHHRNGAGQNLHRVRRVAGEKFLVEPRDAIRGVRLLFAGLLSAHWLDRIAREGSKDYSLSPFAVS